MSGELFFDSFHTGIELSGETKCLLKNEVA